MTTHKIPCEVIQDLLPLYVDELVSDTTREEIKEHLKSCPTCSEQYEHMTKSLNEKALETRSNNEKEIDYLKTLNKKSLKKRLLWCGAVAFILLGALFVKTFFIGSPSEFYVLTYTEMLDEANIHVGGTFYGSADVYSHYKIKETKKGSELILYSCLASPWNRQGVFNLTIPMNKVNGQLDINGTTIKTDGTIISQMANELYQKKNPYIGNASANGALASALNIYGNLGDFRNELQTTDEPYGWTLYFVNSVSNSAVFEEKMKNYACVLIALTENLGEVTWTYFVELSEGAVKRTTTITESECSEYLKAPVKDFAKSPEKVQELLDLLEIK